MTKSEATPDEAGADHTALLERARIGDAEALRSLLVAHLDELQVFVRFNAGVRLAARESVSDLTQSVVGDLLPELGKARFENLSAFRGWLRRAALTKLIDKQRFHAAARRDPRREVTPPSEAFDLADSLRRCTTPSQVAVGREEVALLEQALDRLPSDQRQVLTLIKLLGLGHGEAAEVLGRSEPACRQLLVRGMRKLAGEMEALDRPRAP